MKAMNYFLTAVFVLLLGACTNESQTLDEELQATELLGVNNEESQEIFEIDLRQYYVLNNISELENQKRELIEGIEGGNEDMLSELEAVSYDLNKNYDLIEMILDNTCAILKLRYELLKSQETPEALNEIDKIREKLERCGVDVEDYVQEVFAGSGILYAASIGSRCSPGREWKCKNILKEGSLLINLEERMAERTEARFKSVDGDVISTGRIIGSHELLEGMFQIELQLEQVEVGKIEIENDINSIEVAIELQ